MLHEKESNIFRNANKAEVVMSDAKKRCVGCSDCKGLCQALAELIMIPDLILHQR